MSGPPGPAFTIIQRDSHDNPYVNISTNRLLWILLLISLAGSALSVTGQESALSISGLFDMTITTTPITPVALTSTSLNLVLSWGEAAAQLDARLSNNLFDTLTLSASAPLAGINLNSSLQFNPSTASFISWQAGATFTLLDLAFSNLTSVVDPQTNSYTQWSVSGTAGDIGLQGSVKLGICPLEFWEASVCGNWVWLDCFANMSICVQFDDINGFRNITTTMTDVVLFEDVLGIQGTLDTSVVFSADEKLLTPTLRFTPSWFFCSDIELLGELSVAPPLTIQNLGFYGIRGQCDIGDCVIFTFADSLDDAKNSSITGKAEYFERFGVTGCLPSCCGSDGSFEVNAYFERPPAPSGTLFGMGLITVSFDFQLFSNSSFAFAGEFPMATSNWELAWTFRILW
jgi:hypothetical protein